MHMTSHPKGTRSGIRSYLGLALIAVALTACSTRDPDTIDKDFGNSVRRMMEAQKYDPPTPRGDPMPMDGYKAQEVLAAYRKDVAKPKEVQKPVQIIVGSGK